MDINSVIIALNDYESLKKSVPALKAEHDSLQNAIKKVKELYAVEQKALDEFKTDRVSQVEALEAQRQEFIREKAATLKEISTLREAAEELMRVAKLMKIDIEAEKSQLEKAKTEHKSAVQKLEQNVSLLAEVVKKIS